ncbi:MAG: HyaD/HybD family hydrogenase maturation endopeptidase [Kofleriaceae bacterium]
MKRVVLGVGNTIMSDEGAGVRCVEWLAPHVPPDVAVVDGGTSTHELLGDLEDADLLIIVDAIATTLPPGTIIRLEGDRIPSAFSNKLSPHQHGINDLLASLALVGRSPKRIVLFGIAPERIALGMELTPAVAAAIPDVGRQVLEELA